MLLYDNLDDCKSKLLQTIILYKGKAAYVKDVMSIVDEAKGEYIHGDYWLKVAFATKSPMANVKLSDPNLNYMTFQLGYSNFHGSAVYWYRKPVKQYKQGLKNDQVAYRVANYALQVPDLSFTFSNPIVSMLEGEYPSLAKCSQDLREERASSLAFHKDFALSYNPVFNAFELEYKGAKIGHTPDFVNVNLTDKYAYVKEALMEAIGVH